MNPKNNFPNQFLIFYMCSSLLILLFLLLLICLFIRIPATPVKLQIIPSTPTPSLKMGKGIKGVEKMLQKPSNPSLRSQPETSTPQEGQQGHRHRHRHRPGQTTIKRSIPPYSSSTPPTSRGATTRRGDVPESKPLPPSLKQNRPQSSPSQTGSLHSVHFEDGLVEDPPEEPYLQGNWTHFKPTCRFDYPDARARSDRLFGVDVATECETYFRAQRVRMKERTTEHFAFIVDLDAYEYHKVVFHLFLNEILQSYFFRISIMILVVINAVIIGIQTDTNMVEKYSLYFSIVDQIILSIFLFEIIIKWIYDFRLFWRVGWNILDFIIIFLVILAGVIPAFRSSRALVVVRVVRAFRVLRSVSFLTSLRVVIRTIIRSGVDMGNILLVLMIFMLVMSIMGVILFDFPDLETKHFLSAVDAWFVLFICVTQDGWNQVLDEFRLSVYFPALALYLIIAVSIGAFVFANLIVAVIVANLELSVKEQREEEKISNNPLEFKQGVSGNVVEMLPIYDIACKNSKRLLTQRPLRIPNLRKISQRRLQAYISLIVALEQNMLEADIILLDLEKILAVILSVVVQLDMYSQQKAHQNEVEQTYSEALFKSKKIDGATNLIPPPTPSQSKADMQKIKLRQKEAAAAAAAAKEAQAKLDATSAKHGNDLASIQQIKSRASAESRPTLEEEELERGLELLRKKKKKKSKSKKRSKKKSKKRTKE